MIRYYLTANVNRLFKKCYKFFDRPPFERPPGRFQNFDKYCLNDGSYLVCRYRHCKMNPCTNSFDCGTCTGEIIIQIMNVSHFTLSNENDQICRFHGQLNLLSDDVSINEGLRGSTSNYGMLLQDIRNSTFTIQWVLKGGSQPINILHFAETSYIDSCCSYVGCY